MKKSVIVILCIIFCIALCFRMINLGSNPPALHADEQDTGYTAYSLIKTLRDPYGFFLPIQFRAQANNFRPPVYTYLTIPAVATFGTTMFAERFMSALLGAGVVILVFFLGWYFFKNTLISLVAAGLTAVNPWSIHISRTGLEVGPLLFFVLLGILLFLYTDKKRQYFIILSALSFCISFFTYHPSKIFLPLFIPVLLIFKKEIFAYAKKPLIIAAILLILSYGFMTKLALFNKGAAELDNVTIFNSSTSEIAVNRERHLTNAPLALSSIFHSKPLYYIKQFENMYFGVFSVNYLFLNGESNLDKGVSNYGTFYLFELPFFIFGLYFLFRNNKKVFFFLLGWILLAAVPAGITITGYYTYRDILLLPIPIIFSAYGFVMFLLFIKKRLTKVQFKLLLTAFFMLCFIYIAGYSFTYFFDYPVYSSAWWQYPQKQALQIIEKTHSQYDKVFVNGGVGWAEMYAYDKNFDPKVFQYAFNHPVTIGKTSFIKIENIYFGNYIGQDAEVIDPEFLGKNNFYQVPGDALIKSDYIFQSFPDPDGVHVVLKLTSLQTNVK